MNILAIDTSSNSACLGLFKVEDNCIKENYFEYAWNKKRSHSEVITTHLTEGLAKASLTIKDITHIALGIGPGSFTGIRVALNFAKALAYSHNLDIYTVNSLALSAVGTDKSHTSVIVLNNAFKNMVYGACFNTQPFSNFKKPFACQPKYILKFIDQNTLTTKPLLVGDAVDLYLDHFPKEFINQCTIQKNNPLVKTASGIINCYLQDKGPEFLKWNEVVPLYIRGSEAEEKLNLKNI